MIRSAFPLLPAVLCVGFAAEALGQQQQQPRGNAPAAQGQTQGRGGATASQTRPPSGQRQGGQAKPAAPATPTTPTAPAAPGGGQAALVQSYGDWGVYTTPNARAKVCYALSQPKARTPSSLKDVPGYLFVATRPTEKIRNEVALIMNFDLKESADHQAVIGNTPYDLVAKGKNLWVKTPAEEPRLVEAMRRAADMTVKGVSAKNNATTDKYSLKGFGDALDRVQKECR